MVTERGRQQDTAWGDARRQSVEDGGRGLVRTVTLTVALAGAAGLAALVFLLAGLDGLPDVERYAGMALLAVLLGASGFVASRARHEAAALVDAAGASCSQTEARLEAERAGHNAQLAGIIASAMDAIITVDESHRIVLFNRMAETAFGWPVEQALGQPLEVLLPERFRHGHARHVAEFARTGATARAMGRPGQLVGLRRDGTEFPIEATISQVVVDGRRLLTVILRDTSERVRADEEKRAASAQLARDARRLEAMQEIDRAILAATRLDDLAVVALGRVLPLVGAEEADFVLTNHAEDSHEQRVTAAATGGSPVITVHNLPKGPQRDLDAWLASRPRVVDDLDRGQLDVPVSLLERRRDGMRSYLGTPLMADGQQLGRLEFWAHAPASFTEDARTIASELGNQLSIAVQQTRLRADLHRHAEDLEARVEQRTRALQEVNAELNSFAYSVSHDLRTPLRSMQGFAEALLEDYASVLDDVGRDYARRIVAASRRMDLLIQDLLTYSRLSRSELELRPVALGPLVRTVALQVQELAEAASPATHPVIEVADALPPVLGHRGVLSQVLQNLFTNGIKFVAPGVVPHLRVTAHTQDGRVRVEVQDNGIGIAPEHQERIFRVFERLHRLEAYPGTGIGLAIVRKGVDRLGGRAGVESAPGSGSRFWIELPAADPSSVASVDPHDH